MARSKRNGRLIVSRVSEESYEKLRRLCFEKRNDMTLISGEILDWYLLKGQNGMDMERDIHKEMHRERQENKEGSVETVEFDEDRERALDIRNAIKEGYPGKEEQWVWLHEYERARGLPLTQRPLPYKPINDAKVSGVQDRKRDREVEKVEEVEEVDEAKEHANKLYGAIADGNGLTDQGWNWLHEYEKSNGYPITKKFTPSGPSRPPKPEY